MNIGKKIRELRQAKGITQEQLANSVGVSFQAVSKWENGIAMPDITLAPSLAGYFGVSMDTLFDFKLDEMKKDVQKIADESIQYREGGQETGRKIIEEGLKKYPNNETLLNYLLYLTEDPDETIKTANTLLEITDDAETRYDALRFLAYSYKEKGELNSARAAIEQIPEIYFTTLTEKAFVLEGEEKFEAAEKQKWISFENLIQMIAKTAECYCDKGEKEKAVKELETALELIKVMDNKNFDKYCEYFTKMITVYKS